MNKNNYIIINTRNEYGNVDVRCGVPVGYMHIPGKRLQPTCRRLGIEFADALVGFSYNRWLGYQPRLDGVVIANQDAPRLMEAITRKKAQNTPEARAKRAAARERRHKEECKNFAVEIRRRFPKMPHGEEYEVAEHSCKVGSGRVGRRSYSDEDVDVVMAAVVAHIRHTRTDYDDRLRNRQSWEDRDDIRHEVGDKIAKIVRQWQGKEDEE